jgi:hypothetical protein
VEKEKSLIEYQLQKECNLRKCQIDEVKGIQITKANLVVNALFYASHKIFSHRGKLEGQKLRGLD